MSDDINDSAKARYSSSEIFTGKLCIQSQASNATSMWILTSGLNIGLAKLVGDAFQLDYKKRYAQFCYSQSIESEKIKNTPLIGVCRDTILTYYEKFRNPEKNLLLQNLGNKPDEHRFDLNVFHTNFLLVRDKTAHKSGVNRFLLKLEDAFRGFHSGTSDDVSTFLPSSPVPVIAVLVQGNLNSVHYILAHLKRKLPILVIRGSGGLADILAYAYYEVQRSFEKIKDVEYVENILKKSLSDKITAVFPTLKDNKMAHRLLCDRLLDCVRCAEPPKLRYITVFSTLDLDRDIEDLPSHLLETIFKAQKSDVSNFHAHLKRDLLLTIDWNCPHLAVTKVFYKDPSFKVENDVFEQTLLSKDREEFISMFLDHGFEIHKYMNSSRVITLFEKALTEDFFREVCWERILGYRRIMMLDDYFIDSDLNWIIENLMGMPIYISSKELNECSAGIFNLDCPKELASDVARRKAITVLLIWALISNRGKLAVYLWRHVDQPVMLALASTLILDKIQQYITDTTLKEKIEKLRKQFADMAVGVFDLCYNDMPSKAYDALSVKNKDWGGHSLIDMAALAQNKDLVAHPCCQKWLTNTFMGNIKMRDLSWGFMTIPTYFKVILCAFFVYPMYLWVRFKETSDEEFVGSNEYEASDPYYTTSNAPRNKNVSHEEIGRFHLLKYHYPPMWQMIYWMWSAPITKFWVSHIFYVIYLAIFSVAVIWTSCGNIYLDLLICFWTSMIALQTAHKLYALNKAFPNTPLFGTSLEIIYILTYVIFLFLLRIKPMNDPYGGKILMCLGLLFFYYRMIFIYLPISSTLGPLLYRVKEMITVDFVNFMKLVVLILIANGIAMQAILYPDFPLSVELIRKSFHKAFIAFFMTPVGELKGTEPFCKTWEQKPADGSMCRVSNYVDGRCSSGIAFWPYVIVFQYLLLLKLILLTILFALFSNTGSKFSAESNTLWKFQRYHLVTKFSVSLRLPPPLNIFSLIGILYEFGVYVYKWIDALMQKKIKQGTNTITNEGYFSSLECNYWKQLARDYVDKEEYKKKEEEFTQKESDIIGKLLDDVNLKEDLIYRAKSQIAQLEADIGYTHAHLETLKYHEKKDDEQKASLSLHSLARESPYPRTKIQRFPVPDKYVPWEVMWLHYEPNIYTMPKSDFISYLQPYVDEDILMMKQRGVNKDEIPVYLWNMESTDSNGFYRNRKSWIIDSRTKPLTYRLDLDDLPRNPMGRTGLRGKGALPRWGPNHNVFAVITKFQRRTSKGSEHSLLGTADLLEFVETFYWTKKEISLPGGFAWSENRYQVIQSVFKMADESPTWVTADDMIQFFKQHATASTGSEPSEKDFKSEKIYCGYMDDQLNTDQAWKEVELWHIHYYNYTSIIGTFKSNVKWRILSEDVFIRLPYGQTTLLQDAIRTLEAKIT
ncbi:transient receptor potential cation channel subfamily M member 7-like isoform X2 [Argiope bruennichi]|uniref:transient receptor potential cation channel subfamily M member 7-like isoform X2 n=1 Tax=Argiope bruennichi TaxID=94029 RepID=UPI0024952D05|nr:transient receptor potential cation channel subfamily M member 7-like isoform X2 [Argiope bruennichi]